MVVITLVQTVFLALPTEIGGTVQWPGWLTVGILTSCTLLLRSIAVRYSRLEVDEIGKTATTEKIREPLQSLELLLDDDVPIVGCEFDRRGCLGQK